MFGKEGMRDSCECMQNMQNLQFAYQNYGHLDAPVGDLASWDILQDKDLLLEPGLHDVSARSIPSAEVVPGAEASSRERLKEKNRLAQKRARQRKKERDQTVEAQLAEVINEVQELRVRQKQLEARNLLLEKLAVLNKQTDQSSNPSSEQAIARQIVLKVLDRAGLTRSQTGAVLFTACEIPEQMQPADISIMALTDFAKLHSVYVRKQAQCLLDIEGSSDSSHASLVQLQQWSLEMSALWSCFGIGGPHNISNWHSVNLQDQSLFQDPAPKITPLELLDILDYTDQQKQDMLHLRRLFHGKLGQLARERTVLLQRMADETSPSQACRFNIDFKNIAARLAETQDLSKQLCANRAEENRALIYCGIGLYLCIQSSVQYAKAMVHMYPYVLRKQDLLESLAAQHDEPSMEALSEPAGLDDFQHTANWDTVIQYVTNVDAKGVHGHFSLLEYLQKAS